MKKKVISMLLAAAMTVSMVSGMALTAAAEESTGKELSVQVGPNPETLDPALNSAVDRSLPDRRKHGRLPRTALPGRSIFVMD